MQWITVRGLMAVRIDCPPLSPRTQMFKQATAFVCPWCCEWWAQIQFDEQPKHFWLAAASCTACGQSNYIHPVPGSLLTNIWLNPHTCDEELLSLLPRELVEREFNLALEAVS